MDEDDLDDAVLVASPDEPTGGADCLLGHTHDRSLDDESPWCSENSRGTWSAPLERSHAPAESPFPSRPGRAFHRTRLRGAVAFWRNCDALPRSWWPASAFESSRGGRRARCVEKKAVAVLAFA